MMKNTQLVHSLNKLDTEQLDDDVYLIIGKNKGTFPYSNSLLIIDEKVVLIDSGIGDEQLEIIKDEVDILINSHYHIDHILGNYLFKDLWIVEEEADVTSSFENYKRFAGILGTSIEESWLGWFHQYFKFHASFPTRTFKPNEVFKFGNMEWKAVHTPGHSPGHCAFYEPKRKIMFASDIDLTPFGPWYGNPTANLPDFIDSIKLLSEFKIDIICSSHSYPQKDNIKESLGDYLDIIFLRNEQILDLLVKERTIDDLESHDIIYNKSQKLYKAFAWFEKNMLKKHIDLLMELGKVERVGEKYRPI
ncbi:MAG: MBL fold metallo-hydrolase [Thermoplasmata archaeon]|nr:MAG: MBL fold metallo-hydrolase [Thermoplasmata archaeon]